MSIKSAGFTGNIFLRILLTVPLRFKGVILIPLLTSLFPKEVYGVWVQIILLRDLLAGLTTFRLDTALVRYLEGESDAIRAIKMILTVTVLCGLVLLVLLMFLGRLLSQIAFNNAEYYGLMVLLGIWVCVSASVQITLAVFRSRMKIGTLSIREFLSAIWLIVSVLIAWYFHLNIETLLLLCIAGDSVILLWVLQQLGLTLPFSFSPSHWNLLGRYIKYSLPLVVSFFLLWLTNSVDRFYIVQLLGLESVAVYGVASQVANIVVCLLNPVHFVLLPQISREWERGKKEEAYAYFSRAYGLLALLGIPATIGICTLYHKIVALLAGPDYLTSWYIIMLLSLSVVLGRAFLVTLVVYHLQNKTYVLPFIYGMSSLCNLVLCWLLTSWLGLLGAGLSQFLTYFLALAFLILWLQRKVPLRVPIGTIFKAIGASMIMGLVVFACPKETLLEVMLTALSGALAYFVLMVILGVITFDMVFQHLTFAYREVFPVRKELSQS